MLKIKFSTNELHSAGYGLSEDEKLMSILRGFHESYDSVFTTLIEKCCLNIQ